MEENKKAVVTVIGKDTVGILANVSGAVAAANANIIKVSQSVLEGYFCMIMMINISDATQGVEELKGNIVASVPDMKVHLMHEDIFNLMHRI